jgi:hypothetical protein
MQAILNKIVSSVTYDVTGNPSIQMSFWQGSRTAPNKGAFSDIPLPVFTSIIDNILPNNKKYIYVKNDKQIKPYHGLKYTSGKTSETRFEIWKADEKGELFFDLKNVNQIEQQDALARILKKQGIYFSDGQYSFPLYKVNNYESGQIFILTELDGKPITSSFFANLFNSYKSKSESTELLKGSTAKYVVYKRQGLDRISPNGLTSETASSLYEAAKGEKSISAKRVEAKELPKGLTYVPNNETIIVKDLDLANELKDARYKVKDEEWYIRSGSLTYKITMDRRGQVYVYKRGKSSFFPIYNQTKEMSEEKELTQFLEKIGFADMASFLQSDSNVKSSIVPAPGTTNVFSVLSYNVNKKKSEGVAPNVTEPVTEDAAFDIADKLTPIEQNFKDGDGGRKMQPQFVGKSTMDLVISGDRTRTTRANTDIQRMAKDYGLSKISDLTGKIIRMTDKTGRQVYTRITKVASFTQEYQDATWEKEGWVKSVTDNLVGKYPYAIEFEVVQPTATQFIKGKLDGSKISTEIEGKLDADKNRLISLLGQSMYSEKLKDVVYKELLQNAFDAVKIAESKGLISKGKIDIEVNEKERTITFSDNGIGMTPEIVQKAFFTIGGTYKGENVDNKLKSGGLGLAKMAFIFGSEKLILQTINNGIKTTVDATSEEIRSDNFKIKTEPTQEKNGTVVSVKIPENYIDGKGSKREIDFPRYIGSEFDYSFLSNPLIGNVDISYSMVNRKESWNKNEKVETTLGKIPEGFVLFSPAETSFANIDIYIDTNDVSKETYGKKHSILSSGLYQFSKTFRTFDDSRIPLSIIIDIKPKVDPTNAQYPFNNQRENFRPTVSEDISALEYYLKTLWKSIEVELLKNSFNKIKNIEKVDVDSINKTLIDKNAEIAKEFKSSLNAEGVRKAIDWFRQKNKKVSIENGNLKTDDISLTKDEIKKETEKAYRETFKAEKEIAINANLELDLNPSKPILHNNTTMVFDNDSVKFLTEISSILLDYKRSIIDFYGKNYSPNIENQLWGISIDKEYGGVNVRPSFLNMLAINPFYELPTNINVDATNYIAVAIDHLIIHELNHNFERNEGAGFTGRFLKTYSEIHSLPNHFDLISKLKRTIKNNLETIIKLNNEYKQSENVESGFEGNKLQSDNKTRTNTGAETLFETDTQSNERAERNDQRSSEQFGEIVKSKLSSDNLQQKDDDVTDDNIFNC